MAGRLPKITDYEAKKAQNKADALPTNVPQLNEAVTPQSQSVREGFQQMGQLNPQQPVLEKVNPNEVYNSTRSQALGHESNFNDPQKAMEFWNASPYEFWTEQVKRDPSNIYSIVNQMLASNETPEQKRKRERREALGETFRGLGNLIGNVANLYYTHRGGQYIDLNSVNEKHRERMDRIKEKQDALAERQKEILMNARLGDIKAERAEKAAEKKAKLDADADALKHKREMAKLAIQNAYKLGQIDAQTAADMLKNADKATKDIELENLRQAGRVALKGTPSYGENDVVESFADTNGVVWTRTKPFSKAEKAEFFESLPTEIQQMFTVEQYGDDGSVKSRKVDYDGALGYAINQGYITNPEERGFKKGKSSGKKAKSLPGVNNKGTKSLPGVNK